MNGRARVGMMILICGVCVSAGRQIVAVAWMASPQERDAEIVADYDEHRFSGLSGALPPGGVCGYLTSDRHNSNPIRSQMLAQYALAPCVIVSGEEPSFVVVDLGADEPTPASLSGRPLLRQLANGVRLFGRKEPR